MNTLAYAGQDPQKIGPKVEDLLRGELAATEPLPYDIEAGDAGKTTAAKVLVEGLGLLFGGRAEARLFSVVFKLTKPREARAEFHMNRQGIGCHAGSILFSTPLAKATRGTVWLEDPKMLGSSKFAGDADGADIAAKFNASKDLIKAANAFARVKGNVGGVDITIPRFFKVVSEDGKAMLVAATVPRSYAMGFKIATDTPEFCRLAGVIEGLM